MKVSGIRDFSLTDGEGQRLVIFTSGCIHNCPGCHNKEFQDYNSGTDYTVEDILERIKSRFDWIDGITISGGDPMYQLDNTSDLLKAIRADPLLKDINIWMYTGYLLESIPSYIKTKVDVIVDGPYINSRPKAKWRGSDNQRVYKKVRKGSKHFYETYKIESERKN